MSDKIIRIRRAPHDTENRYFMMIRATPQNKDLSYDAVGMLTYLLSKPDDWVVQPKDLQRKGCGRDKVYVILNELKAARYIVHEQPLGAGKKFAPGSYVVYEQPYPEKPDTENQDTDEGEKPHPDSPDTENPHSTEYRVLESTESNTRTENKDISPVGGLPQSIPEIAFGLEGGKPSDENQEGEGDSKTIQSLEGNAQNGAALPDLKPPVPVAPLSPTEGQGDKKQRAKNPLQEAVAYAFSTSPGPYAGEIISQLTGTSKKVLRKEFAITDPPMTAEEIVGCRMWHKGQDRYKDQKSLPHSAQLLYERVLEFRSVPAYAQFVIDGKKYLCQLLEKTEVTARPPIDPSWLDGVRK